MKISCIATAMVVTTTLGASAIVSTVAIGHDNSNKPIPRYSNGVVIFYERTRPALTVYDREGRRLSQTVLRIEGADVINILDVAADSSGRTIAAASVRSHDGRQVVSALIWSGVNGQIERVVRLDSFAARRVSVTPAGPVFAFGAERDTGGRDTANHQMALLFSAEGKMVSSLAHRSTFASAPIHPSSDGFLFSNRQSFGVFSPLSGIYAEFSLTGQQTGTWAAGPSRFHGRRPDRVRPSLHRRPGLRYRFALRVEAGPRHWHLETD